MYRNDETRPFLKLGADPPTFTRSPLIFCSSLSSLSLFCSSTAVYTSASVIDDASSVLIQFLSPPWRHGIEKVYHL